MLNEIPAATVPGCTFFGANVRTPDGFAGVAFVFSTSKLQIVVGVTGQPFFCLMFNSILLTAVPANFQHSQTEKRNADQEIGHPDLPKKNRACILKQTNFPHWQIFNKTISMPQWINEENTFFDSALSVLLMFYSTLDTLHFTHNTLHFTFHTPHSTLHTLYSTLYT